MDEGDNPALVFEAEDGNYLDRSHVPLVLVHDGGGTCFAYYCLDPLGRPTYEIHNPRFRSGESWAGGLPEMARHYVGLLRAAVPPGRVLLGGWSLGGLLSLEMARLLAGDPLHRVVGIVMVDSVCPRGFRSRLDPPAAGGRRVAPFRVEFGRHTKQDTIERVQWCFAEAVRALETYELPRWDAGPGGGRGEGDLAGSSPSAATCPPAILLRAKESVPVEPGEVSFVDTIREDGALGWNAYREGFFTEVISIPGHHFSVFAWENIETISAKLIEACRKLETLNHQGTAITFQ